MMKYILFLMMLCTSHMTYVMSYGDKDLFLEDFPQKPWKHKGCYNFSQPVVAFCSVVYQLHGRGGIEEVEECYLVYKNKTIGFSWGGGTVLDFVPQEDYDKVCVVKESALGWRDKYFKAFDDFKDRRAQSSLMANYPKKLIDRVKELHEKK